MNILQFYVDYENAILSARMWHGPADRTQNPNDATLRQGIVDLIFREALRFRRFKYGNHNCCSKNEGCPNGC